jgi:Lon protease-like protein
MIGLLHLNKYLILSLFVLVCRQEVRGFSRSSHQQQARSRLRRANTRPIWNYGMPSKNTGQFYRYFVDTQRFSSSASDDDFMASLRSRVQEVNDGLTKLPLVVLDSMLPRQVLKIQANNPLLMALVGDRIQKETPLVGMMGMARLQTGQQVHLKYGVEVEISNPESVDGGFRMELRAGRRFRIEGDVENAPQGWTEARVKFLDSEEEEEKEIKEGDDRLSVARAISKSMQLTIPNMNTEDNLSLVERWLVLAKENERESGQIDNLLQQIGEIPPSENPSERAFWVGALINPLPALGVALEIRPALLTARTAEERVHIASEGILRSIQHMDGSKRLW